MRSLLILLCFYISAVQPQSTVIHSLTVQNVLFNFRETDAAGLDLANGNPCLEGEDLAVWESVDEYQDFIDAMVTADIPAGMYMTGFGKASGGSYLITYNGRLAPFSNFFSTSQDSADNYCVFMHFNSTSTSFEFTNYHYSPWNFQDLLLDDGEIFICMERSDESCEEDTCPPSEPEVDRPPGGHCFWRPSPNELFTWFGAQEVCGHKGGHPMSLLDISDIQRIKQWTDDDQPTNQLWVGLRQMPGKGIPTWWNGELVDQPEVWEAAVNFGSSCNWNPYGGIYDVTTEAVNLYDVAPFIDNEELPLLDVNRGQSVPRNALATCEATIENYCLAQAPRVENADVTMPCCDEYRIRYTCQAGFEFPDGEIEKEVSCNCDTDFSQISVPACILRNPCSSYPCGNYSLCMFTNNYLRPYYCVCKDGFKMNRAGYCEDINECDEGSPCGHYYKYHYYCVNTVGSFWCLNTEQPDGEGGGTGPIPHPNPFPFPPHRPQQDSSLSVVEIVLIVAISGLFVITLTMPFCVYCCIRRFRHRPRGVSPYQSQPQFFTPSVYGNALVQGVVPRAVPQMPTRFLAKI